MQEQTNNREIRLTRKFDAPREMVFDAWTEPEKIGRWWGPDGFTTTTKKMEFKTGGEWIFTMHGPDGTDYPNHIVYTEIVRPERIAYDHYGHKDGDGDPPHFRSTILFEEIDGKTGLRMRMLFPSAEKREEAVRFGALGGAKQTLGRLSRFLEKTVTGRD